jgi:hypothetical protein
VCLVDLAGSEMVGSLVVVGRNLGSKDPVEFVHSLVGASIHVEQNVVHNLMTRFDRLELGQYRSSLRQTRQIQQPNLDTDSKPAAVCWLEDCIQVFASYKSWRGDLQACDHSISRRKQVCCGDPKACLNY